MKKEITFTSLTQLQDAMVARLVRVLNKRNGAFVIRARRLAMAFYTRHASAMGFTDLQISSQISDCCDVARLILNEE